MRCSTHLKFFFNIILLYFAKNTALDDDDNKEIFKLYENCSDTETGSSVHNLAILYDSGALFTFKY